MQKHMPREIGRRRGRRSAVPHELRADDRKHALAEGRVRFRRFRIGEVTHGDIDLTRARLIVDRRANVHSTSECRSRNAGRRGSPTAMRRDVVEA
jgi:hypothetical protein